MNFRINLTEVNSHGMLRLEQDWSVGKYHYHILYSKLFIEGKSIQKNSPHIYYFLIRGKRAGDESEWP